MSLNDVPKHHSFVLTGGKAIKNVVELGRELKRMDEEIFNRHVAENKNDFSNWIHHCVKDPHLAALVRTTRDQNRMAAIIERRIQQLTTPDKKRSKIVHKPTIIRTKNITHTVLTTPRTVVKTRNFTPLHFIQHKTVIRGGKTTNLRISEAPKAIVRIHTPHKTKLQLSHGPQKEIFVHEINRTHFSLTRIMNYLFLGMAIGYALAVLVMALIG